MTPTTTKTDDQQSMAMMEAFGAIRDALAPFDRETQGRILRSVAILLRIDVVGR